ncbi:Inositol-1 [Binucleata daphniae]
MINRYEKYITEDKESDWICFSDSTEEEKNSQNTEQYKEDEDNTINKEINTNTENNIEQDSEQNKKLTKNNDTDNADFVVFLYCGFFKTTANKKYKVRFSLLSLISCDKIGPRFYCRGVDDNGNVSFFVKTTVLFYRNDLLEYKNTILRGSIPLFWYQDKNPLRKNLKYSREKGFSKEAFNKHFTDLQNEYKNIFVINLLSQSESEQDLTNNYNECLNENKISYINFNLNKYAADFDKLKKLFFTELDTIDNYPVFRVNCLDCLDRTNVAQYLINEYYFVLFTHEKHNKVIDMLKELFVQNGHALSNFYCGADSLKSELALKGKRSVTGYLDDLMINATRLINGKFTDKIKYKIIKKLLEKDVVKDNKDLNQRKISNLQKKLYEQCNISDKQEIKTNSQYDSTYFYVLTWCIDHCKYTPKADIDLQIDSKHTFVIISLQKIHTSYKKMLFDKRQSEREKWKIFFENKLCDFVLVSQNFTYNIGTLLFVKKDLQNKITNVETQKIRQEMFAGNVSVKIGFIYEHKTYQIINSDINVVLDNKKLCTHLLELKNNGNYSFMTGYFDTKLCMTNEEIRTFANNKEYEKMITNDFLYNHMDLFDNLQEGEIRFAPGYDRNAKKKEYKYFARIFCSKNIKITSYNDSDCHSCKSNPVYGTYEIQ